MSRATEPKAFAAVVEGRIEALARAHSLLAKERWDGSDLLALRGVPVLYATGYEELPEGRTAELGAALRRLLADPPSVVTGTEAQIVDPR